jgi:probable HAF family extracellular repeat protein
VITALTLVSPLTVLAQTPPLVDMGVTRGNGLNNSGQVALQSGIYSIATRTVTPLPALPGGTDPAVALAINATGQVTGHASSANPVEISAAILYSSPTLTDLGNPCGLGELDVAEGTAINSSGVAVGYSLCRGGNAMDAWIYPGGIVASNCGVNTILFNGINDSGQITGEGDVLFPDNQCGSGAFIYENGTFTELGDMITGNAINNAGQVTGAGGTGGGQHVLLYTSGHTMDLGALPGGVKATGSAINATGQIVGSSDLAGATGTHAFFYNGVLTDLNAVIATNDPLKSFVTLVDATGINDNRLIVTNGTDSRDGKSHAYLLQGPWIDIAPGTLSFPAEAVGAVSPPQTVTVTNSGTTAVSLGSPVSSADFPQTNNCGLSLPAKAACTIQVSFAPTAIGGRVGALTITSNAVPFAVPLSGTGSISATISASPTTVITGTPTKLTWTISPGATCTATGGQAGDGWTGNITASGSQSVTEKTVGTYNYGLSCTAGSQSADPTVAVTVTSPPAPQSAKTGGGGGALDSLVLVVLMTLAGLRQGRSASGCDGLPGKAHLPLSDELANKKVTA